MSAFTNAISAMEGFLGFTGDDPTTEEEYIAALAATDNNINNSGPINSPNCIWLNAVSIETKTNPGPLLGSRLNAKIIGKIAKPANIAIKVSNEATVNDEPTTF